MKRVLLSSFTFTALLFCVASIGHAQITDFQVNESGPATYQNSISLHLIPVTPKPLENITIEAKSLSFDLNRATFTWYINGRQTQKGLGISKIQTTTGNEGSTLTVRAVAVTADGKTYEQTTAITSASVDIIWQAQSYTPPFYKGKALYPYQGNVTFVAMPNMVENGVRLSPKNLIYTWKANGELLKSSSGTGKDSVKIEGGVVIRPIEISVDVSSLSGKTLAKGRTTINAQAPEILLYGNNPLYGPLYHQALSPAITLKDSEMWIKAVPYYFSNTVPHNDVVLSYDWTINNTRTTQTNSTIILRQNGTEGGRSSVSVKVGNASKMLQTANSSLTINFNPQ